MHTRPPDLPGVFAPPPPDVRLSCSPAVEAPAERWSARAGAGDAPSAARTPATKPAAIIVCHGMGQQVQFETLNLVAEALWARQSSEPMDASAVRVRYAAFGDDWLPRVEMRLRTPSGEPREVHLYEVYWAPVTEGKVRLSDVFGFLIGAGARGILYSARGAFDRWMFGARQEFVLPGRGLFHLAVALAIVCTLALGYLAFALLAVAQLVALLYPALAGEVAVGMLGRAAGWCGLVIAMLGAAGLASTLLTGPGRGVRPSVAARVLAGAVALATVAGAMVGAALLVANWPYSIGLHTRLGVLAAGALLLVLVRWFLVQLAGDVAVYISAHAASRFNEIRRQIQGIGRSVARHVYGSRIPETGELEYGDVILVGHSLGSVIAYDVLNDAINGDLLAASARSSDGAGPLGIVSRTKLLLTMGSPLDKTAFLFRTQKDNAPVREALAAAVQPMILSYEHRPSRWINIWSPYDWVSGSLEYYDKRPLPQEDAAQAVENIREENVPFDPVRAHLGYWTRCEFGASVYQAVVEESSVVSDQSPVRSG